MTCAVCGKDVEEAGHGRCWRATLDKLLAEIARLQMDNSTLRERLIDAGVLRRGEK